MVLFMFYVLRFTFYVLCFTFYVLRLKIKGKLKIEN